VVRSHKCAFAQQWPPAANAKKKMAGRRECLELIRSATTYSPIGSALAAVGDTILKANAAFAQRVG
jgi:hypothetical protein